MASEEARWGELTELVTDHVLRDVHGNEFIAVMNGNRMPYKVWRDR